MRTFENGVPMSIGQEMKKDMEEADKIRHFIEAEGMAADQIREAYYRLVGVWDKEGDVDPTVEKLRTMMEASGLPLTRFARLVELFDQQEASIGKLPALIDELQVTPHEKEVLHSVVNEWRPGMLLLSDAKTGELLAETMIPTMPPEDAANFRREIAGRLYGHFTKYKSRKLEIRFIEE